VNGELPTRGVQAVRTIFLVLLGLMLAPPATAQQPQQYGKSAEEARHKRERAIERCKEDRGVDCETDAGLAEWLQKEISRSDAEARRQREGAVERCKEDRGVDCETDGGLAEWLLRERSRSDAEAEGSRSIHQPVPKTAPRPTN